MDQAVMKPRTRIFSHLVSDYMRRQPVVLSEKATVSELLGRMAAAKQTSALITDRKGRLAGIVTEQDVTRRIALRCDGGEPVGNVMSTPVRTIYADDYLYYAIARMRRFGWNHMPVTDRRGSPLGVINLSDALTVAGERVLREIDLITHQDTLDGLREIKAAQVELAKSLYQDNVPAPEIQAVLTHINSDIHRRLLEYHLEAMADAGFGEPPVPFALIIMGSGGRGENFLYPDQDNGFILDDYPDKQHRRIDAFFIELAEQLTRDLNAIGFPYCGGYVMATNPVWRKTRKQWRDQIRMWGRKRSTIAIQLSDIFFDFRGVYGETWMAEKLRRQVTKMAKSSPAFLGELNREVSQAGVALGWFGRFRTEKEKPEHRGEINLKHAGTLPLVSNVRLLCLRHGIAATATLNRIAALHDAGVFDKNEQDYLSGAFNHITHLLLRQQIADFTAGKKVGNHVHPDDLSEREKDILVDSLKAIDNLRKRVNGEFTGELF